MVMNYKRKTTRGAYGEETLKEALSKLDTKSMKSVSKEYGIPRKTLGVIPCQITQWLKRYPPPDFDENLHIWSIWSEKKICQIIAYLVKYFPRYGPLKFC